MTTEFTKLVFNDKQTSLLSDPQKAQNLYIWFFLSSEPRKQTCPIILIFTDIHSDKVRKRSWSWAVWTDEGQSKIKKRLGHTRFTSCSSDFMLKTLPRASKWLRNVNFFSFFCLFVIFDERNVKYYAENIFLIFFMYFQKRETIF